MKKLRDAQGTLLDSDDSSDDEAALVADAMLDQLQETNIMERHNSYVKDWEVSSYCVICFI